MTTAIVGLLPVKPALLAVMVVGGVDSVSVPKLTTYDVKVGVETCTQMPAFWIVDKPSRADCTCAAVELKAKGPVVAAP